MKLTPRRDSQWTASMRADGHAPNTIRRRLGTLYRIERHFGVDADDLGLDDITGWLSQYLNSGTRACYFQDLQAYYDWRLRRAEYFDEAADFKDPTGGIRRPRQPKRLPRPITTEQLFRGLETASGDLLDWILLGAYQGCRVGDAAAMAGENIDGRSMRFPDGKGGLDRTIPLQAELLDVAEHRPRRGWWWPGTGRSGHITGHTIGEKVTEHFTALGVPNFTYHRLRHWCGTEMLRAGASLPEVQQFMRHEVITSTVLYTQVLHDELAVAAARLPRRESRALVGAN